MGGTWWSTNTRIPGGFFEPYLTGMSGAYILKHVLEASYWSTMRTGSLPTYQIRRAIHIPFNTMWVEVGSDRPRIHRHCDMKQTDSLRCPQNQMTISCLSLQLPNKLQHIYLAYLPFKGVNVPRQIHGMERPSKDQRSAGPLWVSQVQVSPIYRGHELLSKRPKVSRRMIPVLGNYELDFQRIVGSASKDRRVLWQNLPWNQQLYDWVLSQYHLNVRRRNDVTPSSDKVEGTKITCGAENKPMPTGVYYQRSVEKKRWGMVGEKCGKLR